MKLVSFEIQNFKCVSETRCYVTPRITVLAGKNESGKTTILNAIERLDGKTKFTDADLPSTPDNKKPAEIRFNFLLDEEEIASCIEGTGIDSKDISNEVNIKISNVVQDYEITGLLMEKMKKNIMKSIEKEREFINTSIKSMKESFEKGGAKLNLKEIGEAPEFRVV